MNSQTASALDRAYEVFAPYKVPDWFAHHSGVSYSLRSLTHEDWDAMDTNLDMQVLLWQPELLRHFLPRFLEWLCEEDYDVLDLSYRLSHMNWLEWPITEVEALHAVFEAWTRELLTIPDAHMPIDFLIEIKENLTPYLDTWLKARPHELAEWLWKLDWKHNENAWRWAIEPHVEAALEAEFFRHPSGERAALLSRTIELIRSLRG